MTSSPVRMVAAVALAAAAACSSPPSGTVALTFEYAIDGDPLELNRYYTTRYGQRVAFDHLRLWVSNLRLDGEEPYAVPESYYLVELTPEGSRLTVEIPAVPVGRYDEMVVHLGVDPARNRSLDAAAGELRAGIGMDWSWDTGYKFFRAEGSFEDADATGPFAFHTGNDVLYKRLNGRFAEPLEVADGGRVEVALRAELDRVFAGVELAETPQILGGTVDSNAGQLAGNYSRMYELVTAAGSTRFAVTSPNLDADDDGEIPTDATPPALTEHSVDRPACMAPFALGPGTEFADAGYLSFATDNDAPVRAASAGVVTDVRFEAHSDLTHSDLFWVAIRPTTESAFAVDYRGLKNLTVSEGDQVAAGEVLGGAGDFVDADTGRISIGVRRTQQLTQRLCPTPFATASLAAAYTDALSSPCGAPADAVCAHPSLVCVSDGPCDGPGDFAPAFGDVDAGRRIYAGSCASCHGDVGEGGIGPPLCFGPGCGCLDCADHPTLAARIEDDMPPEGYCDPACAAAVAAFIAFELATARRTPAPPVDLAAIPSPAHNPQTVAGVALGRALFFDPLLSGPDTIACATCHDPARAFSDGVALSSAGASGVTLRRHTPALINLAWASGYFWDGGARDLESQVFGPLTNPDEMDQDIDELMVELGAHSDYPAMFQRAFTDGLTPANVARAIAQFERTLVASDSRYDRGELTEVETAGHTAFDRHCARCHVPGPFTDYDYHATGLELDPSPAHERLAWGRGRITNTRADRGAYKTPTLRDVARTAPYMHDGRFASLAEVLAHYRFGPPRIAMTDAEAAGIVAFLGALTSP